MYIIYGLIALIIGYDKLVLLGFPQVFGAKHIFVCLIVFLIAFNRSFQVNKNVLIGFLFLFLYLTVHFYFVDVRMTSFVISLIFTLFPFIVFFIASSITIPQKLLYRLTKGLCLIMAFCALPALFGSILGTDIREFSWMYREAGALGSAMVILCILTFFLYMQKKISYKLALLYFGVAVLVIILSGLKKNFVSLTIIFCVLGYLSNLNKKLIRRILVISILGFALTFNTFMENIQDNIDYFNNVGPEGHVRIAMYLTAFRINMDTMLLGTGLGTFGSLGALINNVTLGEGILYELSSVYHDYGIENIAGNSAEKLNMGESGTLLDTYWPHIFGEMGVIGFLLLFNIVFQAFRKRPKENIIIPSMLLLSAILDGFTLIIPEMPLFIFIVFFMSGIILKNAKYQSNGNHSDYR